MLVDLLHLARYLRRSPASAGAAILTLSLTLGAGASIFAVVDAVVLTPPPFKDPASLVTVGETLLDEPTEAPRAVSYATFEAWRDRAGTMAGLEAGDGTNLTVTGLGEAERVSANDVTPGFLTLLGVAPALGRGFDSGDAGRPVVILSDRFWRTRLAADPGVIGRQLVLGNQPYTVVGVLPERFIFELNPSDIWRPIPALPAQAARAAYRVRVVARLARNVSAGSMERALDDVSRTSLPPARAVAIPVARAITGDATRTIGLLAGAAALSILIAFTNLAGLLIVRSIDRRRELAIRTALGARPAAIAMQVVLEAQALVAIGTAGGVLLALWLTPVVAHLALEQFGGVAGREVVVSWRLMAAVAAAASACAWLCALAPAVLAVRRSALDVMRRGVTAHPRELLLRRVFVAGEVAVAFVLLACMTLLGGSLVRLFNSNPGFDARGVLALQVSVPAASYDLPRAGSFYAALQGAVEQRLGPRTVSIVNEIPLTGDGGRSRVGVRPGDIEHEAVLREAGASYFDVMRIPILAGRPFEPRDNVSAPPRVLISESLASRLFGAEPPLGRHLWLPAGPQGAEIVGVAGDVKHRALDDTALPTVYVSALQAPSRSSIVVVRSSRPDADVIAAVREEVARLDGGVPVYRIRAMQDVAAASPGMPARRVLTAAFTGFGSLALVFGAIGLFGVVAHDVASRRAELALRMALGADPMHILRATFGQGAVMVGSGLVVGGLLSIGVWRTLGGLGFATVGFDALSIGVPAVMLVIAGAAAILPAARRAARTDPLIALRGE